MSLASIRFQGLRFARFFGGLGLLGSQMLIRLTSARSLIPRSPEWVNLKRWDACNLDTITSLFEVS
jgi:hypothetical protein